jgi:uncharacterized membrane protein YhaH (DUF805 family)
MVRASCTSRIGARRGFSLKVSSSYAGTSPPFQVEVRVFQFSGRLGRRPFLIGAAIRVLLFAATVVGFPYILWGIAKITNCASVGGACGAVGLVSAMGLKPVFFFGFVFSLVGISLRRMRDTGLPGGFGLGIPLLVLADFNFGLYGGAPWSFAFSTGVLAVSRFPSFMLVALVGLAGLGAVRTNAIQVAPDVAPPPDDTLRREPPSRLDAALSSLTLLPPPPAWIYVVGALLAAGAVTVSQDIPYMGFMALAVQLMPIGFPTFVIYTLLVYGAWLVLKKRDAVAFAILGIALLPYAGWGYATLSIRASEKRETEAIKAINTKPLASIPHVLVFQSQSVDGFFRLYGVYGITEIIADGPYSMSSGMMSYTGPKKSPRDSLTKAESLPSEYLLLKVRNKSSFFDRSKQYGPGGGPYELRYIAPGQDDLIGVWYRVFNTPTALPPVLTTTGWLRAANTVTTDKVTLDLKNFLEQSIFKATSGAGGLTPGRDG